MLSTLTSLELPRVWSGNTLLGQVSPATRQGLLNLGTVVRFSSNREIIRQQSYESHAFLLLEGAVKTQSVDYAGEVALLSIRTAGDLVGEMAALDRKPRSATIVTCSDVVARKISSQELHSFAQAHTELFIVLLGMVNDRLRSANERRRDILAFPAPQRVARVLCELLPKHGRQESSGWTLGIPLTKVELASIAGMKPRTAEKAFSDLRKAGLVVSHVRRDIFVPNIVRLREFAKL